MIANKIDFSKKNNIEKKIPFSLLIVSLIITISLSICSILRHNLYQSNVYDLGLFDQWLWLIGQDSLAISSMAKVHVLSDHAAWVLYLFSPLYKLYPSSNLLFVSQAFALSFTSVPLWLLSKQKGLSNQNIWIICFLWWLQPVVFNANLFDFHPEVWAMPGIAICFLLNRANLFLPWLAMIFLILGCRDGLVLLVAGFGIEQALRKRWKWSCFAFLISICWLLFLKFFLYPFLSSISGGHFGATEGALKSFYLTFINPETSINIDYSGGLIYILLISLPFIPFWKKNSIKTISIWIPLACLNFFSANPSYRTLIHHYNLPIALIGVISVIDVLNYKISNRMRWFKLYWIIICWFALAKPYFFTGPYLSRLHQLKDINAAIENVSSKERVLTTSYIAPHLSHRKTIRYAKIGSFDDAILEDIDVILLNPLDPGWDSDNTTQSLILDFADQSGWYCKKYENGLELCKAND
tara:strand:- start:4077 stop:5480 length:1404 start_codon:yes stop_codon:yes gene_type:complete